MQKKIIALAIAGLASSAAFAQTNVTIYGTVDAGYTHRWDAEEPQSVPGAGQKRHSRSEINTGQAMGNRIGFKGVEDLGNGLKAVFLLEQGFHFENTAQGVGSDGGMFDRQAYVGLTGNFGTAIVGRLYTPHYTFISSLDPFGAGTVGSYRNVWGAGGATLAPLFDPVRVNNAVAYVSPNFGGFDVTVAYSNEAGAFGNGQESTADNAKNDTVYALLAKYSGNGLTVGLNAHRIAAGSWVSDAVVKNVDSYTLGASYDAKVVKVAAAVGYTKVDRDTNDMNITNYLLGVTAPFGKSTVKASIIYSDGNKYLGAGSKGDKDATQYAIGYDYNISKRTAFYAAYSLIDANTKRAGYTLGTGDASNSGLSDNGAGAFQQGLQMGLRHSF